MEFVQYRTGKDDEGRRLDKVLRILFPETPLSSFYSALRKGLIRVNQKKAKQDYRILSDDIIYVADFLDFSSRNSLFSDSSLHTVTSDNTSPSFYFGDICLFRNEHILILNKPYDIPVHETGSCKGWALNDIVLQNALPQDASLAFTPGPLHRLDRKTTGVIAFSQSIMGARVFTDLLKKHEIKKHYLSVVCDHLENEVTFSDILLKDTDVRNDEFHTVTVQKSGKTELFAQEESGCGKQALTTVHPVAYGSLNGSEITFAEIEIMTGRTHQIRSQCAAHGYPLLGDTAYGGIPYPCMFLHAWYLILPYPNALGLPETIKAPLPERFSAFIEKHLPTVDISLYTDKL